MKPLQTLHKPDGFDDGRASRDRVEVQPKQDQTVQTVWFESSHVRGQVMSALGRQAERTELEEVRAEDGTRVCLPLLRLRRLVGGDNVGYLVDGEGLLDLTGHQISVLGTDSD